MQEKAGEQGAAYIPMPKGRGFTPHFDKTLSIWDVIYRTIPILFSSHILARKNHHLLA